jgi:hypothetical protein
MRISLSCKKIRVLRNFSILKKTALPAKLKQVRPHLLT